MSKPTTKMLVPKLRFPEFRDAGEWEQKTLRELAKRITQKNKETEVTRVLTNSAVDGIVDQRDYFDKDIANQNNLGGYFIVDKGDYVYNPRISNVAPVGPISKNKVGKGVMSPLYTVFRFKNSNNGFYEQYFKSTHWYQYLRIVSNSGARHDRMSITNDDFEEMPLPALSADEQQKIANCLSSIDDLITAHSQKHDTLKDHKKGLMQQLFPAEGKTVPKLRFPEFRDAGEWEDKPLGEVATFSKGKGISKSDVAIDGKQPCIRYGELYTLYNETIENVSSHTNISANNLVLSKENDVIIPASGETQEDIATASCVINSGIALGGDLNIIRSKMNGVFLSYYLNSAKKKSIAKLSQGISVVHLYSSQLERLDINIPDLPEQQKIADCLSSIDNLITSQAKKIESLKDHKKGLMHQLFTATDGVGA